MNSVGTMDELLSLLLDAVKLEVRENLHLNKLLIKSCSLIRVSCDDQDVCEQ